MIRRNLANVFSLANPVRGVLFGQNRIEAPGRIAIYQTSGKYLS
jgi:hypothetical protein